MGTLLMKFAGPLQSWGTESRFVERKTQHEPTKSGVVGLLAAALGRQRQEPVDDLAALRLGVRVDQPGRFERDFQTARLRVFDKKAQRWVAGDSLPLSRRYYVADAIFVVALEAHEELLEELANALLHPAFPLYLGRRSCPPSEKLLLGVFENDHLETTLESFPWQATNRSLVYRNASNETVPCDLFRDSCEDDGEDATVEYVRDFPVSFSQERRTYDWRKVVHANIEVPNPHYQPPQTNIDHDPMALFEEVN